MRRTIYNIWSMTALIFISIISVMINECKALFVIKVQISKIFPFLIGRGDFLSNLFLGIGASAFVVLVGQIIDYTVEKGKVTDDFVDIYKLIKEEIFPNLGKESLKTIMQYYAYDGVMSKCQRILRGNINILNKKRKRINGEYYILKLIALLDLNYTNIKIQSGYLNMELLSIQGYEKRIKSDLKFIKEAQRVYEKTIIDFEEMGISDVKMQEYHIQIQKDIEEMSNDICEARKGRKKSKKRALDHIKKIKEMIRSMGENSDIKNLQRNILIYIGI